MIRGKARCNVEFGAEISISVTGDGFTFLDHLSYAPATKEKIYKRKQKSIAVVRVSILKLSVPIRSTAQERIVLSSSDTVSV